MTNDINFTITAVPSGDEPGVTYLVRDGEGYKRVTNDEYCAAINRGEPAFAAYEPVKPAVKPMAPDWDALGWTRIGATSDVPEAFRRQP